jgi:hypothetical protein
MHFLRKFLSCCLVIGVLAVIAVRFSALLDSGHALAPAPNWEVDGPIYAKAAERIVLSSEVRTSLDRTHSVGMQLYVALFYKIFGIGHNLEIKLANFLFWILGLCATFSLVMKSNGKKLVAAFAALLFLCSAHLSFYCDIIQYEIPLMAGLLLSIALLYFKESKIVAGILAICLFAIFVMKINFIFFSLAVLFYCWKKRERKFFILCSGLFFLLSASWLVWMGYWQGGDRAWNGMEMVINRYQHPAAYPFAYPYAEIAEPHGLSYVLQYPQKYFQLLVERMFFFIDYRHDLWHLNSYYAVGAVKIFGGSIEKAELTVTLLSVFLFVLGLSLAMWSETFQKQRGFFMLSAAAIFSAFYPIFFLGMSFRFLVPVIPFLIIFQMNGIIIAALNWQRIKNL